MRVALVVHGFVQGVGYRYFVKRAADALGVRGMVRNESDGSVLIIAEGSEDALEKFEADVNVSTEHGIQVMRIEKTVEGNGKFPELQYDKERFSIRR